MKIIQLAMFATFLMTVTPIARSEGVVMVNIGPSPEFVASARERGLAEAKKDILAGKLYGYYLPPFEEEADQEIKVAVLEKYQIYGKPTSCISFPGSEEYDKAYDDAVAKEIVRRYGEDFWERVNREVEQEIEKHKREG